MRTQKQQHLFRFRLAYISHRGIVYLKSIFAYPSESKLLAGGHVGADATASYPGPDASSLVAAEADALCLGTFLS